MKLSSGSTLTDQLATAEGLISLFSFFFFKVTILKLLLLTGISLLPGLGLEFGQYLWICRYLNFIFLYTFYLVEVKTCIPLANFNPRPNSM